VKNAEICTSVSPYEFIAWCLVKRRDNFAFTFFYHNLILPDNYYIETRLSMRRILRLDLQKHEAMETGK
jgi:hypothetical protein